MLTIGLPGFIAFVLYSIIWGLLRNALAGVNAGNTFGKALAAVK